MIRLRYGKPNGTRVVPCLGSRSGWLRPRLLEERITPGSVARHANVDFASSTTRRLSMLAIALLMVMYVGAIPFSIVHMDLARDMGIAHTIVTGEALPLQGPVFASAAHLGPVWYYLLAMLLWLTHSWLGTMLAIGAIASLKFPLAYMLGSRLIDGTFGLLWALMLTLPGWNTFESIYLLHT